jgi:hypothetical protein
MQPVGKLLLRATGLPHATGIAKGRLEIAKALVPAMAIHSPCRCLQRARSSWRNQPSGSPDPVHRNPEQSAEISDLPCILLPLEKHIIRTAIGTHSRFTRQDQSYAEWLAVARKTFPSSQVPGIARTRPTVV